SGSRREGARTRAVRARGAGRLGAGAALRHRPGRREQTHPRRRRHPDGQRGGRDGPIGRRVGRAFSLQSGLGKEAAGEGMLGLQRAFAVSGCKTAVCSLWSVHDAATSVLMERFYFHLWQKKVSKLEALRQAQLEVMRHPEWVEERAKKLRG